MTFTLALSMFLAPAADADFEKAKAQLKKSLVEMRSLGVRDAAGTMAEKDQKASIPAFLDAYGVCVNMIAVLWRDKAAALQGMERNKGFKINTSTNPPTVSGADAEKYKKYKEAEEKGRAAESRIMEVEACKRALVDALARCDSEASADSLSRRLGQSSKWEVRAAVAEVLGRLARPGIAEKLAEVARRDSEPQVRVAALDALRELREDSPRIVEAVVEQLRHDFWPVKAAAVSALRAIGARGAVEPLIEALGKNTGRLREDISEALKELTGIDKHGDPATWKAWWKENGEKYIAGEYEPPPGEGRKAGAGGTTFYGIPVLSENVVFILDRSGSMAEPSEWKEPRDVATGPARKGDEIKPEGNRKIDVARWQLKRALAMMPDGARFNVIFYNHEWAIFSGRMAVLNDASRRKAFEFIDGLEPVGSTNCYDPLEKGLSFAAAGVMAEKILKDGVDTVFFLSDGMPNSGQVPRAEDIVVKIRDLNRTRKVRINTIGVFGTPGGARAPNVVVIHPGAAFLRQLAEESGGVYRDAGGQDRPQGRARECAGAPPARIDPTNP